MSAALNPIRSIIDATVPVPASHEHGSLDVYHGETPRRRTVCSKFVQHCGYIESHMHGATGGVSPYTIRFRIIQGYVWMIHIMHGHEIGQQRTLWHDGTQKLVIRNQSATRVCSVPP